MPVSRFTEQQKRLAFLLSKGPNTVEGLAKELKIANDEAMKELKAMLGLGLITKEGYPSVYSLSKGITAELGRRKDIEASDNYKLRLLITIDVLAIEKELLEKQLAKIEGMLRKEKDFTIYDMKRADIIQEGEHYSSYVEVNLSVKNFSALVRLMYSYGPGSVEVLKPSKYEFTLNDLQDGLVDMASMIHSYNNYIIKNMTKKEMLEFNRKLFE